MSPHEMFHNETTVRKGLRTLTLRLAHYPQRVQNRSFTLRNIYLVGSLRNPEIPNIARALRGAGHYVFDDWYAAGPHADDCWRDYSLAKGQTYREALEDYAAKHVFDFDRRHLERCDTVILALPAGKSGHLELGWAAGAGKSTHIILDSPDRWDVMYQFAHGVWDNVDELIDNHLGNYK